MADKPGTPAKRAMRLAGMGLSVAGSYLGYLAQHAFLNEQKRASTLKAVHGRAASRMRTEMQSLRGPAMKLGQALSLHAGVLPEETILELTKLQMEAPGMHPSLMRAQFRACLGKEPDELFHEFDESPFAAASLGQVHRAITKRGDAVAVKIQYPGIRDAIANDFKWFRSVSRPVQATGHVPRTVIDELEAQISVETDYMREADNIDEFRKALEPLPFVKIPRVYRDLSGEQVLTMSLIGGRHLDDFIAHRPLRALRDLVGERLFELFYFQLLEIEAFHADPHGGNYLFGNDGSIGLIDFGCIKRLTPDFVASMRELYLYPDSRSSAEFRALIEKRHSRFSTKLRPAARDALIAMTEKFYGKVYPADPARDSEAFDFGEGGVVEAYARASQDLLRKRGAFPEYIFVARAEIGLYNALARLKSRVHTSRTVRKYLRR